MKKKIIFFAVFALGAVLGLAGYTAQKIPDNMYFCYGEEVAINSMPNVKFSPKYDDTYTASLLGLIPVKEVAVSQTSERYVIVSGRPFGIKMFCDGVMLVGFTDILTAEGYKNPAKMAGLKTGDIITHIDGVAVQTNEEVGKLISASGGKVSVRYLRKGTEYTCRLTPVLDATTKTLKSGMWVRDSCAGVGTMTFYDAKTGGFAGLGHGIKDVDTQEEIRLLSGEIVNVKISGITKSKNGTAGQLKGTFTEYAPSGKILINNSKGVYGKYYQMEEGQMMPVATPTSVKCGRAQMLTTINGNTPQLYDIEIEKVALNSSSGKDMVIKITDSRLLSLTGGIVRGMSGSPIIQNGYLVGAVTHVFVNQVDKGYGILAWDMLQTSDSIK